MTSVIIVTHVGGTHLDSCLDSVLKQGFKQIIVVATGTTSIAVEKPASLIYSESNSYAHAVNTGLRQIEGDHAFILNDDTCLHQEVRTQILKWEHAEPSIVAPTLLLDDNRLENGGHWIFSDGFNIARGRGRSSKVALPSHAMVFSGAAVWIHSEAVKHIGFFDEELGSYGEDVDYSLRAIRQGYAIHHDPQIKLFHALGATRGRSSSAKAMLVEQNRIQAAVRSLPKRALLTMPLISLKRYALMGAGACAGRGVAGMGNWKIAAGALKGHWLGMSFAPRAWKKRRMDALKWQLTGNDMYRLLSANTPPLRDIWHPNLETQ